MAASAQVEEQDKSGMLTPQRISQLLKLLPNNSRLESESEEEIDSGFAGIITCCSATINMKNWVIDTGASDHMVCDKKNS